jgi:hypothetical protein
MTSIYVPSLKRKWIKCEWLFQALWLCPTENDKEACILHSDIPSPDTSNEMKTTVPLFEVILPYVFSFFVHMLCCVHTDTHVNVQLYYVGKLLELHWWPCNCEGSKNFCHVSVICYSLALCCKVLCCKVNIDRQFICKKKKSLLAYLFLKLYHVLIQKWKTVWRPGNSKMVSTIPELQPWIAVVLAWIEHWHEATTSQEMANMKVLRVSFFFEGGSARIFAWFSSPHSSYIWWGS